MTSFGSTLDTLLAVTTRLAEDMEQELRAVGLTTARVPVLWCVAAEGGCTQRMLADRLRVSPRNITALVDALVGTGFVERRTHPGDRRAVLVELTERGDRTVAELQRRREELAGQLFGGLSKAQYASFARGLRTLEDTLDQLTTDPTRPADASPR